MLVYWITFISLASTVLSDREHKVHNIVLYPERHSWCQTTPIKQIVTMPGFEPITIDNNVCVGACYSYSIPHTQPAEPGELIGPYCDSCQPLETKCYHVTLKSGTKTIQKRVQIITNCSCSSCNRAQNNDCDILDTNTSELPLSLLSTSNRTEHRAEVQEIPELLNLNRSGAASPSHHHHHHQDNNATMSVQQRNYEINAKLIALLKSIQEDDDFNVNYDREQLKELLEIIEGSEHELSDKNLMDFVNFVNVHNSEDLELDLSRLKEVLVNFQQRDDHHHHQQHHHEEQQQQQLDVMDLNKVGADNNQKIEDDLNKYELPKSFGLEENHFVIGHHKGTHNAKQNTLDDDDDTAKTPKPHNHHHHHHHVGDVEPLGGGDGAGGVDLGHLILGPHGSLAIAPSDAAATKFNLRNDEMKPNHDGVVISYENLHRIHHGHHKLQQNDAEVEEDDDEEF